MATVDFLSPAYLEQIVAELDKTRAFSTPALNMFFKKQVHSSNGFVKVQKEVTDYDDILPLITKGSAIPESEVGYSREYTTYELKLFGDLKTLTPADIKDYLNQVAHLTGETYKKKKVEIAQDIITRFNNKVNATREYMACSALAGSIKDKDGNVLENFNIPTTNKLGDKSLASYKLFQILRDMQMQMRKATKYRGRVGVVLGAQAEDIIINSSEYENWVRNGVNQATTEDASNGIGGFLGSRQFPYLVLDDFYYDKGTAKNFFTTDTMLLAPIDAFAEFYGSVETAEGSFAKTKHIDSFLTRNPDGTSYRIQSSTMPIVTLPNGIVTANIKA